MKHALTGSAMEIFYEPLLDLALKMLVHGNLKTLESTLNTICQQIEAVHGLVQLCMSLLGEAIGTEKNGITN
jgi:hypothetical protein